MVQEYWSRIRQAEQEAKAELAVYCRENLRPLIGSNHRGTIQLGVSDAAEDWLGAATFNKYYWLKDGHLYENSYVGRKRVFPKYEIREITPEEIPFEEYDTKYLPYIAEQINKAQGKLILFTA